MFCVHLQADQVFQAWTMLRISGPNHLRFGAWGVVATSGACVMCVCVCHVCDVSVLCLCVCVCRVRACCVLLCAAVLLCVCVHLFGAAARLHDRRENREQRNSANINSSTKIK